MHDLTKFWPQELFPYDRQFFGDKGDPAGFAHALLHHWNFNKHHYQYWMDRPDHSGHYRKVFEQIVHDGVLKMPEVYVREMVADWLGASMAYTGSWDMTEWLAKNLPRMKLHPDTRTRVHEILDDKS